MQTDKLNCRLWQLTVHATAFSALSVALLLGAGAAEAAMYRWVDGNGRVHYSDTLPVNAVLTFGTGVVEGKTMLNVTYRVGGNAEAALDKLAGPVDGVIGEATARLIAHAEASVKP